MSANQKIILTIFVIYLALNAIIGIVFSKRQGSKQNVSSEVPLFPGQVRQGLLMDMPRHGLPQCRFRLLF